MKLFKKNTYKDIIFINNSSYPASKEYFPKPASSHLPDWYKKTQSYVGDEKKVGINAQSTGTIKKCIPVFDALSAGYIITTCYDVLVKKNENNETVYIPSIDVPLQFHSTEQAPYHPFMNHHLFPKWLNPWGIKTPKGYSCLFVPPVHGGNQIFTVLEGIVDTDRYFGLINFPFVLNDVNFEGMIPAGTPIVQIIPIKRDEWRSSLGSEKDLKDLVESDTFIRTKFFDRYKTMFWDRKSYK
jgi:hypothetical protein